MGSGLTFDIWSFLWNLRSDPLLFCACYRPEGDISTCAQYKAVKCKTALVTSE